MGKLVLRIDNVERVMPDYCMHSCGNVHYTNDDVVIKKPWIVEVPDDLLKYKTEIEKVVNDNVPWGCCGGCI